MLVYNRSDRLLCNHKQTTGAQCIDVVDLVPAIVINRKIVVFNKPMDWACYLQYIQLCDDRLVVRFYSRNTVCLSLLFVVIVENLFLYSC